MLKQSKEKGRGMRKLIASVNVTLDGFMAGPDGNLDWHFGYWNNQMSECLGKKLATADTILLGANTYQALSAYWPSKADDLSTAREDIAVTTMMNQYIKAVVSSSLSKSNWHNTIFLKGSLKTEIKKLKKQAGRDIVIMGSCQLLSALIKFDLIDRYDIWLHPVIIKKGKPLFRSLMSKLELRLTNLEQFSSGVVHLEYERKIN